MQLIREIIAIIDSGSLLFEGGAATKKYGTTRATREDLLKALTFIRAVLGSKIDTWSEKGADGNPSGRGLLGSAKALFLGKKQPTLDDNGRAEQYPTSGDADIAVNENDFKDRETVKTKMALACGMDINDVADIGGNTFTFAVPIYKSPSTAKKPPLNFDENARNEIDGFDANVEFDEKRRLEKQILEKRIQVDLMFTPHPDWAEFGYHSELATDKTTAFKGAFRNALLDAAIQLIFEEGKDIKIDDPDGGAPLLRVRRSFFREGGLKRLFKYRPLKKTKSVEPYVTNLKPFDPANSASMKEVKKALEEVGINVDTLKFDARQDPILDPDKAAKFLFGSTATKADLDSVRSIIKLIKKTKKFDASTKHKIFDLAVEDVKSKKDLPKAQVAEFKQLLDDAKKG